jgi:NADPH:quinone reductase-like Zn-dependent oxidoreductase
VASSVRTSGEVLLFGILESSVLKMECMDFILRNVRLQGYNLAGWMRALSPTEMQEVAQIIMGLFEKKIMHPLSGEKFPLSKFNQAIAKSQVHREPIYLNNLNIHSSQSLCAVKKTLCTISN